MGTVLDPYNQWFYALESDMMRAVYALQPPILVTVSPSLYAISNTSRNVNITITGQYFGPPSAAASTTIQFTSTVNGSIITCPFIYYISSEQLLCSIPMVAFTTNDLYRTTLVVYGVST